MGRAEYITFAQVKTNVLNEQQATHQQRAAPPTTRAPTSSSTSKQTLNELVPPEPFVPAATAEFPLPPSKGLQFPLPPPRGLLLLERLLLHKTNGQANNEHRSDGVVEGKLELLSTAIMDGWMSGLGVPQRPSTDALRQLLSDYTKLVYSTELQHLKDIAATLATKEADDIPQVAQLRSVSAPRLHLKLHLEFHQNHNNEQSSLHPKPIEPPAKPTEPPQKLRATYDGLTMGGGEMGGRNEQKTNEHPKLALTFAVYAASRDCTKALRGSSHKAVDKGRPVAICDSGSLEHMVVKPGCAKEGRAGSAPDPPLLGISPGSLSAGMPSASKNIREKLSAKSGSGFASPSAKGTAPEQHFARRGMRTTMIHRDPSKTEHEEGDSQWSDAERQLFTEAVAKFGKEFKSIADHVGSKTQTQCKTFFSKTRKRFKLDELVEQSQESAQLDSVPGGAALKIESTGDEKLENLGQLPDPVSGETSGGPGQESKVPGDQFKLDMAVADGLMLLGQALEGRGRNGGPQ
ncbi:unnamed protein product [Calypogeia fissa]